MYIITILNIIYMIYKAWTTQNYPWGTHPVCANTLHPTLTFDLYVIGISSHFIYRMVECAICFKADQSNLLINQSLVGLVWTADSTSSIWLSINILAKSLMNYYCDRSGVPYRSKNANRQLVLVTASRNWKARLGHHSVFHDSYSARGNIRIQLLSSTSSLNWK